MQHTQSGKEILQGSRQEWEDTGEAQKSTCQEFGGTREAVSDTGPGAVIVWPQNKAGKQPKSLPALGATSQASAWKTPHTAHCMRSDNTCMAQHRSATFTMENPGFTLWTEHSVTNVADINRKM